MWMNKLNLISRKTAEPSSNSPCDLVQGMKNHGVSPHCNGHSIVTVSKTVGTDKQPL